MAEPQSTFRINLGGDATERIAALGASLEALQKQVQGSQANVKGLQGTLRNLRGTSDDVTAAKDKLKAAIANEKAVISAATVALVKHGDAAKTAGKAESSLGENIIKALHHVDGPLKEAVGRFGILREALTGAGGAGSIFAIGIGITIGAVVALTAAVGAGVVSLLKWSLATADAQRDLALTREAFAGSAKNGAALGTQVDALAAKVPIAKEKLNEMSVQLLKTRLSGQAIVDTFNVTAVAAAAMGDDVGKSLQEIITRGQLYNRFRLNPLELQGTGVQFNDVVANLAKQMGVGINAAKKALFEGRVKLDDGAKALRTTVEKRFGEVNAKKMLSFGTQFQKLKESLANLTTGINLEPLLKGFHELAKLFDTSTVAGVGLKTLITAVSSVFIKDFADGIPLSTKLIKGMIIAALELTITFLTFRKNIKEAFGPDGAVTKWLTGFRVLIDGIKTALGGIASFIKGKGSLEDFVAKGKGGAPKGAEGGAEKAAATTTASDVLGAIGTFLKGRGSLEDFATKAAAKGVPGTLKGFAAGGEVPRPQSPDSVFVAARPGERILPPGVAATNGGGLRTLSVPVTINVAGGADHAKVAQQLAAPDFLAQFTKAVEDACRTAGIPTQTAPTNG